MSVQLTSSLETREPDAREQPAYSGEKPGEVNESSLDRHIEAAIEKHGLAGEEPVRSDKPLGGLAENIEKAESRQAAEEEWKASEPSRRELDARYQRFGANTKQNLDMWLGWARAFKANPALARDEFAQSYLAAGPFLDTKSETKEASKTPEFDKSDWRTADRRRSSDKLDALISDAYDNAAKDKEDLESTAEQRQQLSELFGVPFGIAMQRLAEIDREMIRNPVAASERVAQLFGLPTTPMQHAAAAQINHYSNIVDHTAAALPDLNRPEVTQAVTNVLNRPEFVRTNDPQADLVRAYQFAAKLDAQEGQVESWGRAQLAQMEPELAQAVVSTIFSDRAYQQEAAKNARGRFGDARVAIENFNLALGWAKSRIASVARARRASPVRSSGGAMPSKQSSDGGIDRAISAAMSKFGL